MPAVVDAFRNAHKRLLLLDYDGTLVPFANRPTEPAPPATLINMLDRLAGNPANCLVIVSGRASSDLETWFGHVRGLWLAAEHGLAIRPPATSVWEPLHPLLSVDWKGQVYPVLEHFADRTPGSIIEEKEYSLVWHYRMSDPDFGEPVADELVATLEEMLAETELRATRGQKIVEVKLLAANKGEILAVITKTFSEPDFLLAIGDDRTDEDLFDRMPPEAWTVHVGNNRTRARFRISDPEEVRRLLQYFCEADEERSEKFLLSQAT